MDEQQKIDWVRVSAGALAAVSSAVLLSTLGAAGTIIGAALGSVIASVGTSLYTQGIARSRRKMAEQTAVLRRVGIAQAEVRRAARRGGMAADAHLEHADEELDEARAELDEVDEESWKDRLRALPWKRIGIVAAGLFLVTVLLITGFELITGRPVSSYTGGTSGHSGSTLSRFSHQPKSTSTPTTKPSSSTTPSSSATPSDTTSPSASGTATESTTPTETTTPSESASASDTPSADTSASGSAAPAE